MSDKTKKKLNKCLLISFIIGVLYVIDSITYWGGAMTKWLRGAEQLGAELPQWL